MGTFTVRGEGTRGEIDQAVAVWKERCLLGDGSLLFPDSSVWTKAALDQLYERYVADPKEDKGDKRSFDEKLEEQLAGADPEVVRLMAEMILVYSLFVGWQVRPETQREQIRTVLVRSGTDGDADAEKLGQQIAWKALDGAIGNPGGGYIFNRWRELNFIVDWVRDWKALEKTERSDLLDKPREFQDWLDARATADGRQFRHILLNLLWPESYERIASGRHKRDILETFSALIEDDIEDDDEKLAAIRARLRQLVPKAETDGDPDWMPTGQNGEVDDDEFDFYRPPVEGAWFADRADSLTALRLKKALVLHGPPGTGKTHESVQLAAAVVRRTALEEWGAADYFERLDEAEKAASGNVHRLQLHPAYSYEDFIGGLRLTAEGGVEYKPGRLPRLCEEIEADSSGLPHVLIIDEMNRADLSRVFGEAFSAFEKEKRGQAIDLSVEDPETGQPRQLKIPPNLYLIGTMNLIDQSVEQIDFAMRRRFLWQESRFAKDALLTILEERWRAEQRTRSWDKVAPDMELLAESAERLNQKIASVEELGENYEIGHTYMLDIVELLDAKLSPRSSTYLWTGPGAPKEALEDLWSLALEPLLREYLAGLDAVRRAQLLEELWTAFKARS